MFQPGDAPTPPRVAVMDVRILADPQHPDDVLTVDANTADVIYWERPTGDRNPHVVGVYVKRDGSRRIFFGVIPPP